MSSTPLPSSMASHYLIRADAWIDRNVPGLAMLSNLVNIVLKIGIAAHKKLCYSNLPDYIEARQQNPHKHYWEYIENKELGYCFYGMLPFVGQILNRLVKGECYRLAKGDLTNSLKGRRGLENVSLDLLHNKKFMVEIFKYYQGVDALKEEEKVKRITSHPRYQQLPEKYRKQIESEALTQKQATLLSKP